MGGDAVDSQALDDEEEDDGIEDEYEDEPMPQAEATCLADAVLLPSQRDANGGPPMAACLEGYDSEGTERQEGNQTNAWPMHVEKPSSIGSDQ